MIPNSKPWWQADCFDSCPAWEKQICPLPKCILGVWLSTSFIHNCLIPVAIRVTLLCLLYLSIEIWKYIQTRWLIKYWSCECVHDSFPFSNKLSEVVIRYFVIRYYRDYDISQIWYSKKSIMSFVISPVYIVVRVSRWGMIIILALAWMMHSHCPRQNALLASYSSVWYLE